jgi:hypothetical protein
MHSSPSVKNVEESSDGQPESADSTPALICALRFVRKHWISWVTVSIAVIVPCYWHQHIEAGDLPSHVYNAWLAQLIERCQAPGLYLAPQWTNFLFDVTLLRVGNMVGLAAAEKIVVSGCVLIFFWGAFAIIAAASRQRPWFLVPAIAMIAYGWTFHMGFMNFYLSLGLGFMATAIFWRGRSFDFLVGSILLLLALSAHVIGFLCVTGAIVYIKVAESSRGWRRWMLIVAVITLIFAVHFYIVHNFHTDPSYWVTSFFYLMNGADQLILYSAHFRWLAIATFLFGSFCFLYANFCEGEGMPNHWCFRTPLELWCILLFTATQLPELIIAPICPAPICFIVCRLTSITAVMGLCMLGFMRPRWWHVMGFAVLATAFFVLLNHDTGKVNKMEQQVDRLVDTLPSGRRVIFTIAPPSDSRIYYINHIVDRACIGHCFSYSNLEAPFGDFRVHVRPGSPIVTDSQEAVSAMEDGSYTVRPEDLPMNEIYQCDEKDLSHLCIRDLTAGEKNGRLGYHAPAPKLPEAFIFR